MGVGWLVDFMFFWLGVLLVLLVGGEYWWLVIIFVGVYISFLLGYGWLIRYFLMGMFGLCCCNFFLFIFFMFGFVVGY